MYSGFAYSHQMMISLWFFLDYTELEKLNLSKDRVYQTTCKIEVPQIAGLILSPAY